MPIIVLDAGNTRVWRRKCGPYKKHLRPVMKYEKPDKQLETFGMVWVSDWH